MVLMKLGLLFLVSKFGAFLGIFLLVLKNLSQMTQTFLFTLVNHVQPQFSNWKK